MRSLWSGDENADQMACSPSRVRSVRGMRSPEGDRRILTPHNNPQQQMAFFGFPVPFLDRSLAQPYRRYGRLILHEENWFSLIRPLDTFTAITSTVRR
jgi:hypothetical protein